MTAKDLKNHGGGLSDRGRAQVERELAALQDRRRALAPRAPSEDAVGDEADSAETLRQRDEVTQVDSQIAALQDRLAQSSSESGENQGLPDGTEVTVRFPDGEIQSFQVVLMPEEAAGDQAAILTADSPLGLALSGHRDGEVVTYTSPTGPQQVEILALSWPASE